MGRSDGAGMDVPHIRDATGETSERLVTSFNATSSVQGGSTQVDLGPLVLEKPTLRDT